MLTCEVCGNTTRNNLFIAKERMLGLNDEFEYFECSNCLCIQIKDIPAKLDRYYPENYYSFTPPQFPTKLTGLRFYLKKSLSKYFSGKQNLTGFFMSFFYGNPFPWFKPRMASFDAKILDVGCGAGRVLLSMQRSGYKNLTGIDPYINEDIFYEGGIAIHKKEIFEVNEKYDLITLHHSFEHMENPQKVLLKLSELINQKGYIIIRIPVANSYAWRKYKTYWYQLDAPRHFFLHSTTSMSILAKECHLKLVDFEFDSNILQFTGSEKYLQQDNLNPDTNIFTKKQLKQFKKEAQKLNQINDGDSVCFYLQKE